jgi:DNA-binding response OmpR family regulator
MTAKFHPPIYEPSRETSPRQPDFRHRILVVEDEEDLRQLTAEALKASGYHVDGAADGIGAWAALQIFNYDLLITNQFVPKMSGVQLLKKMQKARMTQAIIMVTGVIPTWEFTLHTWLQPAKMLLKPYTFEKLLGMVKNVLHETAGAGAVMTILPKQPKATGLHL